MACVAVLAFVRSFAYLAHGSSFGHGSETEVGGIADRRLNDLFTYIGYQAAVSGLEPLDSSILHDLSLTPREKTAVETTEELRDIYVNQPVETWGVALDEMDVPRVYEGMCGFIVLGLSIYLDYEELVDFADLIVQILGYKKIIIFENYSQ